MVCFWDSPSLLSNLPILTIGPGGVVSCVSSSNYCCYVYRRRGATAVGCSSSTLRSAMYCCYDTAAVSCVADTRTERLISRQQYRAAQNSLCGILLCGNVVHTAVAPWTCKQARKSSSRQHFIFYHGNSNLRRTRSSPPRRLCLSLLDLRTTGPAGPRSPPCLLCVHSIFRCGVRYSGGGGRSSTGGDGLSHCGVGGITDDGHDRPCHDNGGGGGGIGNSTAGGRDVVEPNRAVHPKDQDFCFSPRPHMHGQIRCVERRPCPRRLERSPSRGWQGPRRPTRSRGPTCRPSSTPHS